MVFDAARSRREFVLFGSDYAFATLGAAATKLATQEAPRITFRFKPHTPDITENAVDVLRTADGIILPRGLPARPAARRRHRGFLGVRGLPRATLASATPSLSTT